MSYKAIRNLSSDGKLFEQGKVYSAEEVANLDLTNFTEVDAEPTATPEAGTFAEKKENADGGTASSVLPANEVSTGYVPDGGAPKETLE